MQEDQEVATIIDELSPEVRTKYSLVSGHTFDNERQALADFGLWLVQGVLRFVDLERIFHQPRDHQDSYKVVSHPTCEDYCVHVHLEARS